jgi:galactose-1-phosphate uridylyltransferase
MPIEFKRTTEPSRWLDPRLDPPEQAIISEWRTDPLTGDLGMLINNRFRKLEEPDFAALVAKSKTLPCPFCPENIETTASKFPPDLIPEGRIRVGETFLFANIAPWVAYSAVAVFSPQHFTKHIDFDETELVNGFIACQEYLKRLSVSVPEAKYHFIGWNYLPTASSSVLHPHLQVFASAEPLRYQGELLRASRAYYNTCGTNYWADLVAVEKKHNERYIGAVGATEWLASYVSRSWLLDVTAVFPGKEAILDLTKEALGDLVRGLKKVFRYMASQNFYSFNLALYSGLSGEGSFWSHARLIQRATYGAMGQSDAGTFQLLQSTYAALRSPEHFLQATH